MENLFIPYKLALKLKYLGFNEPCLVSYRGGCLYSSGGVSRYYEDGDWNLEFNSNFEGDGWVAAPTFSQGFKWFRENHKIASEITCVNSTRMDSFKYCIHANNDYIKQKNGFDSHEEAELACLTKLIEIVETKNK